MRSALVRYMRAACVTATASSATWCGWAGAGCCATWTRRRTWASTLARRPARLTARRSSRVCVSPKKRSAGRSPWRERSRLGQEVLGLDLSLRRGDLSLNQRGCLWHNRASMFAAGVLLDDTLFMVVCLPGMFLESEHQYCCAVCTTLFLYLTRIPRQVHALKEHTRCRTRNPGVEFGRGAL